MSMFQSPGPTLAPTTSARRSTRVSRAASSISDVSSRGLIDQAQNNINKPNQPVEAWTQVLRPPRPGVAFQTLKWVKIYDLTEQERKDYENEKRKLRGKVLNTKHEENVSSEAKFDTLNVDGKNAGSALRTNEDGDLAGKSGEGRNQMNDNTDNEVETRVKEEDKINDQVCFEEEKGNNCEIINENLGKDHETKEGALIEKSVVSKRNDNVGVEEVNVLKQEENTVPIQESSITGKIMNAKKTTDGKQSDQCDEDVLGVPNDRPTKRSKPNTDIHVSCDLKHPEGFDEKDDSALLRDEKIKREVEESKSNFEVSQVVEDDLKNAVEENAKTESGDGTRTEGNIEMSQLDDNVKVEEVEKSES